MAKERRPRRERKIDWPGKGEGEQPPAAKPVPPAKPMGKPVPPVKPAAPGKPPVAPPVKPVKPAAPVARPVPTAKPVKPAAPVARPVPTAKPVKPAAPVARPVPTAKPVKPVTPGKPPVAPPVKPVRPVAPVAKPVAPVAKPVAPVAKPVAKPVAPAGRGQDAPRGRGSSRRAAEVEIGGGGGGGGRGGRGRAARPGSSGMSLAMKSALLCGLVTLAVMGLVLMVTGKTDDADRGIDEAGWAALQTFSATDPDAWIGGAGSADPIKQARNVFFDLFGDQHGREYWDDRFRFIDEGTFTEDMDPEVKDDLTRAKQTFFAGEKKWKDGGGSSSEGATKLAEKALERMGRSTRVVSKPGYVVMGAWLREASGSSEGKYIGSYPGENQISYDWQGFSAKRAKVEGQVVSGGKAYDVSIYAAPFERPKTRGAKAMRAYVALWENKAVTGAGGNKSIGLLLAILGPLLVAIVAFAIASAHTKNVRSLAREIDRLGTSGDAERQLRTQGGDAAIVARAVERMVNNLEFRAKHGDADLDEIAEKERKVAEEIHGALMSKHPPRLTNWEVETLYKPGFEIAGDHFEYFPIDEHHLGVILLDTNVRGLPAALVMASARSYVRAAAAGELSPAALLKTVNKNLAGDLPPGRHVTALYVVIDTREGKATIASAGHLPLLVYRHADGKVAKVNPEGIALGLDPGPVFDRSLQEGFIPIGVGDRIVLYTDGALNITDDDGEEFGETRFYETVTREAPKNSQAFVNFVGGAIDNFHLTSPQNDDVTISTVKRLR